MGTMAAIPTRTEGQVESVLAGRMDVTPEELLAMPDGEHYELVNGVPVAANDEPALQPCRDGDSGGIP